MISFNRLMFGCYSVINIVVLLNLLIAMMNHSYQLISVSRVCLLAQIRSSQLSRASKKLCFVLGAWTGALIKAELGTFCCAKRKLSI